MLEQNLEKNAISILDIVVNSEDTHQIRPIEFRFFKFHLLYIYLQEYRYKQENTKETETR